MVNINSITFTDEYGSTTNYLMGCVGDKITANINFSVEWNTTDVSMVFSPSNNTITRNDCGGGGSFINDGFNVGDLIEVSNNGASNVVNGTYSIINVSPSTITTDKTYSATVSTSAGYLYGITPISNIDFYYNLIGNNDAATYNSLIDNTIQKFTGTTMSGVLNPVGKDRAWTIGSISGSQSVPLLNTLPKTGYTQNFNIQFPFLITPLFLSNQLSSLQNGGLNAPSYFINQCLKFIYQIDIRFSTTAPQAAQSSLGNVSFPNGNTAWFDSFFPTGIVDGYGNLITEPVFDITSVNYYNAITGATISELSLNEPTNVVVYGSNIDTPAFNVGGDKYVLNFMWLPTAQSSYQNSSLNMRQLLCHDRVVSTIGSTVSVNGDQYGTGYQSITGLTSSIILDSNFRLSFTINLGETVWNNLISSPDYIIWMTPQSTVQTDRTALIIDVNTPSYSTNNLNLLQLITKTFSAGTYSVVNTNGGVNFYNQLVNINTPSSTYFSGAAGSYGLAEVDFYLLNGTNMTGFRASVDCIVNGPNYSNTFNVYQWNAQLTNSFNGVNNNVNINQSNGFLLPSYDNRNNISFTRNSNFDTATYSAYNFSYGFQVGYEWWQNLSTFDPIFNNYHSQYWPVYSTGRVGNVVNLLPTGYSTKLVFNLTWTLIDSNGITTTYVRQSDFIALDNYNNSYTNASATFSTYDLNGRNLNGVIPSNTPFKLVSTWTMATYSYPGGHLVGELGVKYNNGVNTIYDKINSDELTTLPNSVWQTPASIIISSDYTKVSVSVIMDLSVNNLSVNSINIYSTLSYAY